MFETRGHVRNGRIVPVEPIDLPEGTEVRLIVGESEAGEPRETEKIGMNESEWSDTPEAIEEWIAWSRSLEPVEFAEEDEFTRKVAELSREAVRRQMFENDQ